MKTKNLSEIVDLRESVAGVTIDPEKGIVKDVVLLTGNKVSKNKTSYGNRALAEAVSRYEGAKMFIDHGDPSSTRVRSIRDLGGSYHNVRLQENKVIADLQVLEHHRATVLAIAKQPIKGVGLSIRDRGHGEEKNGVFLVEGFAGTEFSIDLVSEASVNANLFESHQTTGGTDMELKDLTLDVLRKERPDLLESIRNEATRDHLKEIEEAKKKGEDSAAVELRANKTLALCEADFSAEVRTKVKEMIESKDVSLDAAKAIIKGQKEIVESLAKANAGGDPTVTGAGPRKIQEAAPGNGGGKGSEKVPSDDETVEAFRKR